MPDPLDDFERSTFTSDGVTRAIYRTGSGPAEKPGIGTNTIAPEMRARTSKNP